MNDPKKGAMVEVRFRALGAVLAGIFFLLLTSCETNPLYYSYPEPRPIIKDAPIALPLERAKYTVVSKTGFNSVIQWSAPPVYESKGEVYRFFDEIGFLANFGKQFYFSAECPERMDLSWIALYFGEEQVMTNFFVCDLTQILVDQGTEMVFPESAFKVGGGLPRWNSVRYFQLAFQAKDGKLVRVKPYLLGSFGGVVN